MHVNILHSGKRCTTYIQYYLSFLWWFKSRIRVDVAKKGTVTVWYNHCFHRSSGRLRSTRFEHFSSWPGASLVFRWVSLPVFLLKNTGTYWCHCQLAEPCNYFFVASAYLTACITEALSYDVRKCRKVNLIWRVRQALIMAQKFRNLLERGVT